jgi:hypothetical protein
MTADFCMGLFIFGVITFGIFFPVLRVYVDRRRLLAALEREGAKNIVIRWRPFRSGMSTRGYLVTFENKWGKRRKREGRVGKSIPDVDWKDEKRVP